MRIRNFVFGLLLTTMIVLSVAAQQISEDPPKVVIVPRTYALPVVVYQPDCPILLEKYSVMSLPEGGSASAVYSFKNTGAKPIQSYSIAWLTTSGTGGEGTFTAKTPTEQIQPGERIPTYKGRSVLVPLTEDIRKALKFDEPMIGLFILIVVRIEYADGTVFSDEPTYKALKAYLEKLGGKQ